MTAMTNEERRENAVRILDKQKIPYRSVSVDGRGVRVEWMNGWFTIYEDTDLYIGGVLRGHRLAMEAAKAGCPCCDGKGSN